jgi:hypothetical protein
MLCCAVRCCVRAGVRVLATPSQVSQDNGSSQAATATASVFTSAKDALALGISFRPDQHTDCQIHACVLAQPCLCPPVLCCAVLCCADTALRCARLAQGATGASASLLTGQRSSGRCRSTWPTQTDQQVSETSRRNTAVVCNSRWLSTVVCCFLHPESHLLQGY